MKQNNTNEIKNALIKTKDLAMILYVLSQIPSYTEELVEELKLPKSTVEKAIHFLREKKLIRVLNINTIESEATNSIYPLMLKKIKKIQSQLSQDKLELPLNGIKFYFISSKGKSYLQFVQEILFKTKKGTKK